ncbi:MAG TPA: calcium-binding protein, partial [Pusillimonas sp.]|uniref:calcium-binding protein n=1 Tax=Pusillimonas sp. TaxID=3040095 RepID=UPI002D1A7C0F
YEAAFKDAANWFESGVVAANKGTNLTYFITDGKPTFHQENEGSNPVVHVARNSGKQTSLESLLNLDGYNPGDTVTYDGRTIVDATGVVYSWHYESGLCNSGWKSDEAGQILADGAGGYEFSSRAGNGDSTSSDTTTNSLAAFALLEALSTVEAIGLGGSLSIQDLENYDSDGTVQTNIDPTGLAEAILGSDDMLPNGNDEVFGGEGNDILFGDTLSFARIDGNGYNALKEYVADRTGSDATELSNQDLHQYISTHSSEFNKSNDSDGSDELYGGTGNDLLFGQGGNDLLVGGQGDDILYGGSGADTFRWDAGDEGRAGAPAVDRVMDFNAAEGDTLDLSSLLQERGAGSLDAFLQASRDEHGDTVIHVSTKGELAGNDVSAADQTIHLAGVEYNTEIVQQLIDAGRLTVDGA